MNLKNRYKNINVITLIFVINKNQDEGVPLIPNSHTQNMITTTMYGTTIKPTRSKIFLWDSFILICFVVNIFIINFEEFDPSETNLI